MSPSCYITTRVVVSGKRYVVRFRRGGRTTKLEHAGSFKTQREALERRNFVAGELAAGRDPIVALRALQAAATPATFFERFDAFIASRVDVGPKTIALYRNARDKLGVLSGRDPLTLGAADFQTWIASASAELSPKSIAHYLSSMRQVLDFCGIEPNPARSRQVRLPTVTAEEISPPSTEEWLQIRAQLVRRSMMPARLAECCALRISEAVDLTYGDVDFAEGRIRVSRARTKRRTAGQRWIPVPRELLDEIAERVPLEDRYREREVFDVSDSIVRSDLARACRDAGIAAYSPHDLRHRRVSLWFAHGLDPITVKTWAGHSRASMSLDTYAHVVIDPNGDEWHEFWVGAYRRERLPGAAERRSGEVPVRTEDDE